MLMGEDVHVLRRGLEFVVEGQWKKGRSWKRQIVKNACLSR